MQVELDSFYEWNGTKVHSLRMFAEIRTTLDSNKAKLATMTHSQSNLARANLDNRDTGMKRATGVC